MTIPRLTGMLGGRSRVMPNALRLIRPSLAALSTMLPHGFIDAARVVEPTGRAARRLARSPAVDAGGAIRDGQRVVFGRDEQPPIGTAIAASCAIPLLLRPVRIGRHHHYIDGATHSPTNADLLVDAGVEVAIVIAPMSGRSEALRRRPDHAVRAAFARRLREEAQQLVHAGVDVHLFEPDAEGCTPLGSTPSTVTHGSGRAPRLHDHRKPDRSLTHCSGHLTVYPTDITDADGQQWSTAGTNPVARGGHRLGSSSL